MIKIKKILTSGLVMLFTFFTVFSYLPAQAARKPTVVPQVRFANAPVTEYKVGDRVGFNIYSPNYGGRVEYRVVLWNDSKKSYSDLWYPGNGYPTRYYSKWQPYGNGIFTLGWIINEPGSYRITVYAKRAGIPNSQGALKGLNCDSYMESVAFKVKSNEAAVQSILPAADITVNQYGTPALPTTVTAVMNDATQRTLRVTWGTVNTTTPGTFTIQGTVEGTTLKASLRLIVNSVQTTLNVYSVEASSISTVNVNLRESISFIPQLSSFSLSGYGVSNVRLYSLYMSTDKRIVQLSTDTLTMGNWYTLKLDGREYTFQVPYSFGSGNYGNRVSLTADNIVLSVGGSKYPDITVYPSDATLSFTSYNSSIARYDSYDGKIEGISKGTTTFYVTASRAGYTSASTTFTVTVGGGYSYLSAEPEVLYESPTNDGSLVSGLITVESSYEYFRSNLSEDDVIITGLPHGFDFEIIDVVANTLTLKIIGKATSHRNIDDTDINVVVYNDGYYYGYNDYMTSNDIRIDFSDKMLTSVDLINDISKPIGTLKADLGLPAQVNIHLSDGTNQDVNVTWDNGTPTYNANLADEYVFKGTVALPSGVTNPSNLKAQVNVTLGNSTVNVTAADFGVMDFSGVMGYSVGFNLVDATAADVRNVVVNLYKGNTLLATNTSKDYLLTTYSTLSSLSAPFDVFGTFDYATDGCWTYSGWQGANADIPTQAVIIVTFKNGLVKTAVNNNLTGDSSIFTKGDVVAQDFGAFTNSTVHFEGYSVGLGLVGAKAADVESIVVELYKGSTLLATNTSHELLTQWPNATNLSAPFDVLGTFDYEADGCWTYSGWNGANTDIPTRAEIKVTFKNGIVKAVINTTLAGHL